MEEIINEMKSTYSTMENYKNLIPDDLSSWGHAGLSKNDFFESFLALIEMAEKIGNISANSRFTSLVKTNIRNTLTNINNQLKSFNSNPTAYFNNIMNFIQQSFLGLSNLLVMQPNNQRKKIPQSLLEEIAVISGKVNEAKKIIGDLKTWHDTGAEYHENIEKLSVDASDKFDKLEVAINEINETFKNSEQIIENISDREETTKDLSDAIEDTKILITEHSEKLKDIIKNSIDQQKIIKNNIDDSNKAGLAGSFKRRKDDLKTSIILWSIGLGISLILMFIISIKYILPEINNGYEKFLAKLPLIGPLIWSAWFCAKQFGLNNKIREDYAFKYASAMAYEGYKKETREVDEEMLKTLMEKSINNFSENPLRLITEKDGHNSPSNEIIDSFFKTIDKYGVEIIKKIRD